MRKLILSMLILCVAIPTLAQVEFTLSNTVAQGVFQGLTDDQKNTAEYLLLMNQDEYCSSAIQMNDGEEEDERVCVFEDPETDTLFLYLDNPDYGTTVLVSYNGQIAGSTSGKGGMSDLIPGKYEVFVVDYKWSGKEWVNVAGMVMFTIHPRTEAGNVEFNTEPVGAVYDSEYKRGQKNEQSVIADYAYRTQRENYCTADLSPLMPSEEQGISICIGECDFEIRACVFEHPVTRAQFLRVYGRVYAILFSDGQMVLVEDINNTNYLTAGEYKVMLFHDSFYHLGTVFFTIQEPGE